MPLAVDNSVSAFAAYKGLAGNLSKKQRRRRNKKKNIQALEVLNGTNNPVSSTNNEPVKKRKNTEAKENDLQKQKKRKVYDFTVNKGQEKTNDAKSQSEILMKKMLKLDGKKKSPTSKPGKFLKDVKSKKQTGNGKRKQVEKVFPAKNKLYKGDRSFNEDVLLTEEQIIENLSELKNNSDNQVPIISGVDKKNNKLKTASKIIAGINLENQTVQSEINEPSLSTRLAKTHRRQDNRPNLISEIKQLKRNLSSKDITRFEKPTYNQIIAHQNTLDNKLISSTDEGKQVFQDLIAPYDVNSFFRDHWEKSVLYVPAPNPEKFSDLISTELIDEYLRENVVMFGKHIDITSYVDGKRETHNPEGRALPHVVWDLYNNKCSVRLLCPQAVFSNIFSMNTKLQEYFGCFVGANAYLTPPKSQGFAPHYDDIEAFVLQIEGQKKWKIYNPRNSYEALPRYSSRNFSPSELEEPIMEVTLRPGDMLYFPRGYIHQAECSKEAHSLHITISMYQKNSWIDLLEKAVPLALSNAAKDDVEFRRGLPLNYLQRAGLAHSTHPMRNAFIKSVKEKMVKLIKHLDIDKAVDMMGVQFITDALPPVFNHDEASRCVLGNGLRMEKNGQVKGAIEFAANTKVRFCTSLSHRLIKETVTNEDGLVEEEMRLYYSNDNSLEYHGEEPQYLIIPEEYVPSIRLLSVRYPNFTAIKALPLPKLEQQASLVGDLWDRGILMTDKPLEEYDVEYSSSENEENTSESEIVGENLKDKSKKKIDIDNADDEYEENEEDEYDEEEEEEFSDKENDKSMRAYEEAITNNQKFIEINEDEEDFDEEEDDDDDDDGDDGFDDEVEGLDDEDEGVDDEDESVDDDGEDEDVDDEAEDIDDEAEDIDDEAEDVYDEEGEKEEEFVDSDEQDDDSVGIDVDFDVIEDVDNF